MAGTPDGNPAEHDHDGLLSELSDHDLAFAADPQARSAQADAFVAESAADPDSVFPQSVCSGGPTPSGVILWTRIDPDAFRPTEPLAIEVAADPDFDSVAYRGVVTDTDAIAAHDHTVKADLDGVLDPGSTYHYRFTYNGTRSRVGRCRTLPARDSSPEDVSFVVLTCQNYTNGYYSAYEHVADEDVDFVVFVGDFIYESSEGDFRGIGSPDLDGREIDLPSGNGRVHGIEDYRYLYRTYRSDGSLQRAFERHTMIPAWDDHEIADDIYWDYEADAPRADHPRSDDPEFMTHLTADAIHAWWEYMPARIGYDPTADALQERFQLWREVQFGDLVELVMTDERLFRSPPPDPLVPTARATADGDPPRTMLGDDQREWFLEAVGDADARWTVWSDEVLTVPFRLGAGPLTLYPVVGGWDGYRAEREQLTQALADMDLRNLVTLTGDMHCAIAGYKATDYPAPLAGEPPAPEDRIGVEFMTPAVTSITVAEALGLQHNRLAGPTKRLLRRLVTACNPHIEFFDSHHNGYSVVEFSREACSYRVYAVDKTVDDPDADRDLLVALRVPDGEVRFEDVTDEYR